MPPLVPPHLDAWQPGRHGKGFTLSDGRVFTWTTDGVDGRPVHDEGWYNITRPTFQLGVQDEMYANPFYISPEGEVAFYGYITTNPDQVGDHVVSQDPRLHHQHADATEIHDSGVWNFTASTRIPPIADFEAVGLLSPKSAEQAWDLVNNGWSPGKEGKGLVNAGQLYTWNVTNDDGWPHHDHVCDLLEVAGIPVDENIYYQIIVYIDPDGEFDCVDEQLEPIIHQQDPRLEPTIEGWHLGHVKHAEGDGGGGGDMGGGDMGGEPAHDHSDHVHYLGYGPWFGGPWGISHSRFQAHHRKRKKKKRKKKSDFWDDQRRQDFPEDFESNPLEDTKPTVWSGAEVKQMVDQGHTEGHPGKGLMINDDWVASWNVDVHGGPHHDEVIRALNLYNQQDQIHYIGIDPDGTTHNFTEELDWHFGAIEDGGGQLDWEEGNDGKGLLLPNGTLYTWNTEDYESHAEYTAENMNVDETGAQFLYIDKNGKVTTAWGGLTAAHEEQIREADPRLYVDIDLGNSTPWNFGSPVT